MSDDTPDEISIEVIINGTEVECYEINSYTDFENKILREEIECAAVPKTDLEILIEQWESTANMKHPEKSRRFNARCDAWRKAAQELREALEQYE